MLIPTVTFALAELASDRSVQMGVVAFVGALGTQALRRRWPAQRLVFQLGFFLVLSALLHHYDIVPYQPAAVELPPIERVFETLAKIVWWMAAAWLLTGVTRLSLIFERRPRESRLAQDLVVGAIYLGAALSVVAYVFEAPVGTLIATSGVLAIILGLALQSTLADVFSGIALNLAHGYAVGDWIVLGGEGVEGRVVETNWRATWLLNGSNDLVVLPNSRLAKAQLTNLSSPNRSHGVRLPIRIAPTMVPSSIAAVMRNVLLSSNTILATPAPTVEIKALDAQAIEFELAFRVADFDTAAAARHEVYDLIYRHTRANGLQLAGPREQLVMSPAAMTAAAPAVALRPAALRLVEAVPLFASLTDAEKTALAESMTRKTYAKGEVLAEQGTVLDTLTLIRTGVAVVTHKELGGETELARLAPGDYFGSGEAEAGTVRALTFTVAYEIGREALAALRRERPGLAEEIGLVLAQRARGHAVAAGDSDGSGQSQAVAALLARVRRLIERPPTAAPRTTGS